MTAVRRQPARTLPRPLVGVAWAMHRAVYRLSGGRAGLAEPEPGRRFGMMRLATIGRRSGKPRVAIVGYFEDGANLVTVAMNGWAAAEPAWWLNLQANPNAVVGLATGARSVRGRVADGAERDALWARLREFPGWGDDMDALAARRPTRTAVVVLEPRADEGEGGRSPSAGHTAAP